MSREIKFRAWDKEENKFFEPAPRFGAMTISITLNGEIIGHPNIGEMTSRFELSQFTGLLDKNGKEIYEGDFISENGSSPYEVIWQNHSVQWIMQSVLTGRSYRHMAMDYAAQTYEIIGNIHQNSELLNTEKK